MIEKEKWKASVKLDKRIVGVNTLSEIFEDGETLSQMIESIVYFSKDLEVEIFDISLEKEPT